MKNKLIINIILVYFVLLAIVLVVQMKNGKHNDIATEPLKDNVQYSNILSESVVLYDRSPVMLVKQKQRLVNGENAACVPVIEKENALVPINFFEEAYGAVVSSDESRQSATIRLNNKALVVDGEKNAITLVSASKEKNLKSAGIIGFKNEYAYIDLKGFAEGFNKELSICDGMALLSDREFKLDKEAISGFVAEVEPQVNNLPSVDEQQKLEELLGNGAVNIFNTLNIGEAMGIAQKESPATTLGLDANGLNTPVNIRTDGEYIYFIRDNALNIATMGERCETISRTPMDLSAVYGLYISGKYISVVGSGRALIGDNNDFKGCTIAVYDITDKSVPKLVRQVGAEGSYSLACKKDDIVYLFIKKEAVDADSYNMPNYFDSANTQIGESKSLSDVRYVPEMADKAYTSVLGFNITDMGRALRVYTLLGCGDNYSLTGDSLYIAVPSNVGTSIYKLSLNDGGIKYAAAGYTDMSIPDDACLNEYNGILRLASAKEDKAYIALLDDEMEELASIKDIPIEGNMVSARFIGGRGYLVSDSVEKPIYAVDLTDEPKAIGEINVPNNTKAVRNLDAEHFVCAKNDGSISMLNIADINNQFEAFTVQSGGVLDTDKMILNTEDEILAIPAKYYTLEQTTEFTTISTEVTSQLAENLAENTTEAIEAQTVDGAENETGTENSEVLKQGVCVYKIDLTGGSFVPVNVVTHTTDVYTKDAEIRSVLYKDGRLYTVSNKEIKSSYVK